MKNIEIMTLHKNPDSQVHSEFFTLKKYVQTLILCLNEEKNGRKENKEKKLKKYVFPLLFDWVEN